jgi:hypothetical protein
MTKKTKWSHLPNAEHIDRVLASLKSHPEAWAEAWNAASYDAVWSTARYAAGGAVWTAARYAARNAARVAAWDAAWDAARSAARYAAWDAARNAAYDAAGGAVWTAAGDAARNAAYDAAGGAVWTAAGDAARNAARVAAYCAAWDAISALVAWDNSAKFLDMTSNELNMWWALSEDPAAILLLSAVQAFEQIKELELI